LINKLHCFLAGSTRSMLTWRSSLLAPSSASHSTTGAAMPLGRRSLCTWTQRTLGHRYAGLHLHSVWPGCYRLLHMADAWCACNCFQCCVCTARQVLRTAHAGSSFLASIGAHTNRTAQVTADKGLPCAYNHCC
jgi:hypothetical protein